MIDLLVASVDDLLERADRAAGSLSGARALVGEDDLAAADRRLQPADARRTLAGRLAVRLLVADTLGATVHELAGISIDRTCDRCGEQHGRPRAHGLSLSSSSSGGVVAAALGPADVRIGVDLEVVPDALWRGFDSYALHPRERDGRPGVPVTDGDRLAAWTEKEAILKAAGVGLRLAPSRVRLGGTGEVGRWRPARLGVRWRSIAASPDARLDGLRSTTIAAPRGARAALAASEPLAVRRREPAALLLREAEPRERGLASAGA